MQHLHRTPLDQLFVIDIETVPCVDCHDSLDEMLRQLWEHKSESLRRQQGYTGRPQAPEPMPDHLSAASLFGQAGIYAEFGKVVCVSVGYFTFDKEEELWRFRVKSFAGHDEKLLLRDFAGLLAQRPHFLLCAHNGKEFDFPYLAAACSLMAWPCPRSSTWPAKSPGKCPTTTPWSCGSLATASPTLPCTCWPPSSAFPRPKTTSPGPMWRGCTGKTTTCRALPTTARRISSPRPASSRNSGAKSPSATST